MIQTIDQLKSWYITQAKPVQQQFWDWIDSFRHRNELIGYDDLTQELKDILEKFEGNTSVMQRIELLADGEFSMNTESKLVGVWVKNNSGAAMTIVMNYIDNPLINWIEEEVLPGSGKDIVLHYTFPVQSIVRVTGVTGPIVLLIDRKS